MNWWPWLTQSTAGLALRIGIGVAIFLTLAIADYTRNGPRATRWREYAFLLACVAAAILYGIINDQITCTLSWEYFYYGKDLDKALGPAIPPDEWRLHIAAAGVGAKATWTAGLIIGVALLMANNPSKSLPRLPVAELLSSLPLIFAITASAALLGAGVGYLGWPAMWNDDFAAMVRFDEWRPTRFMTVYGIHLGGYIGGLVGLVVAIISVRRQRRAWMFRS